MAKYSVILVCPEESRNIGSVARAMKNLGFSDLRLVAPVNFELDRALMTACHAEDIVRAAQVMETLQEALADCHHSVGFTGRLEDCRPTPILLPEWAAAERSAPQSVSQVGLVFGPESTGLHLKDLARCQTLVRIPAATEYASFNLSQAVLLALYEIQNLQSFPHKESFVELPTLAQIGQLEALVLESAKLSGFFRTGTPPQFVTYLPSMVSRMRPDARELQILLGLFSRIVKTIRGEVPPQSVPHRFQDAQSSE